MPRKSTNAKQMELLIPSLALSMLVLMLVGTLVTLGSVQKSPETSASADNRSSRQLTRGMSVADLESDLLLLQEDNLDSELSVLEQVQ